MLAETKGQKCNRMAKEGYWRASEAYPIGCECCDMCSPSDVVDTPTTDKQSGIATSNTQIGGSADASPKPSDDGFANSQDVKPRVA